MIQISNPFNLKTGIEMAKASTIIKPLKLMSLLFFIGMADWVAAKNLAVGPGKSFARIEAALAKAEPGDTILVYQKPNHLPYEQVALYVSKPRIAIKAVRRHRMERIRLSGDHFNYSGRGSIPRAIVQFSQGADASSLEGFELYGAHNDARNAAGVRIDKANDVTIRDCTIHDNDMGMMSNGDGTGRMAVNQRIEGSLIYANGDLNRPGFSHNLYLGGASAILVGSEIHSSVTGHNIKSRAHRTSIMACYIHDSANRELDLVDAAGETDRPNSDAVLAGNLIVKSPTASGNHQVIHFGRDGHSQRNGTLYLIHNNIITPFGTAVIRLSSPTAQVRMFNNIVWGGSQSAKHQNLSELVDARDARQVLAGFGNRFSASFAGTPLNQPDLQSSFLTSQHLMLPRADPAINTVRLLGKDPALIEHGIPLPSEVVNAMRMELRYYISPQGSSERLDREKPSIGAYPFKARH